ncbi:hypothetical protein ONZ43_g5332 [Nemania bipapillata]|uniref:Uncharacterized protein n=1 Tax=Nemania bipapillata TaxID=110536 RepID=A0ACC2IC55_9PEZI|nr:hypothetical protein ONZ43_g5332 [Nemania bipapillata]
MNKNEPIAIVGSACRFAGTIDTPSKLWELLREPRDMRREIPGDRFSVEGFYHPNGAYHGHSNVKHAYIMDHDPSHFDAEFFGIKPSEAKSMDPQQRVLLEVVYESIEAAGMTIAELSGSNTGVYAGLMTNDYGIMLTRDLAHVPTYHATGISGDGVTAIVLKNLSAAVADGDHIECVIRETGLNQDGSTPGITMPSAAAQEALIRSTYAKAGLDSRNRNDHPQYFEAHGTGTPAGDPIEAEAISNAFFPYKGSMNGDSHTKKDHPLYVGSIKTVLGHTEGSAGIAAILRASLALQNSTIPPNLLFNKLSERVAPFYDNLEILREAKPWPELAFGQVRRASVNSFGFGGANAHAILESYPPSRQKTNGISNVTGLLFTPCVFSASSEKILKAIFTSYASYLSGEPDIALQDLAWTLRQRRAAQVFRASFSVTSLNDLAAKIAARLQQGDSSIGVKALPPPLAGQHRGILGVFTGQGAQYARMGAELIEQSPLASRVIKDLEMMLSDLPVDERPSWSLRAEILANATSSRVHQAAISQPLCTAVQILMVDFLRAAKVNFCAVVGHSSGEIAAAYAASFLTAREAIYVAYYRGFHLCSATSPNNKRLLGGMLAVGTSMEKASELCARDQFDGRVSVAASNSSSSVTISGDEDAIAELQVILDTEKTFNRRLKVDKAYHSNHMRPCVSAYVRSLKACVRERQVQETGYSCTWYSSVFDEAIDPAVGVSCDYWAENMAKPVLFSQAITRATTEADFEIAIEVGAHPALKGPASQTMQEILSSEKAVPYFGTLSRGTSAVDAFSATLGQLWCILGPHYINLDNCEKALSGNWTKKHNVVKGLPTYPWEHGTSYWHEARASRHMRRRKKPVHPLLGHMTTDSTLHHQSWRHMLRTKEIGWLSGHAIQGQVVFPAAGYICSALEASRLLARDSNVRLFELTDFTIHHAVVLPEDDAGVEVLIELVHIVGTRSDRLEARFTYSAAVGHDVETLTLAASATVVVKLGSPSISLLPPRSTSLPLPHATNVDTDSFYSALADLGYEFSGPFCSLSQLTRIHGRSCSIVRVEPLEEESQSLLIHPAELDAAFQAILLACSYPRDEQLRVLHLPTSIRLIRVNPALYSARDLKHTQLLPIEAAIVPRVDGENAIVGDVNVFPPDSANGMVQLHGAELVPFGGAAAEKDDRQLFSTVQWINSRLDGSDYTPLSQHQHDAMRVLERISAAYLRQLDRQLPADHPSRFERPLSSYIDHARHITSLVDHGKHGHATEEWIADTPESVARASRDFSELPDVRLMHLVGERMLRVLRGETTMTAEFHKTDIVGDYFLNGVMMQASASWITGMMSQITERLPHLNVLEIGPGSGEGATSRISRAIDKRCLSYTYADGTVFYPRANDAKPVRTFDVALEPTGQGYVEGYYDVIIASWVLHAVKDILIHHFSRLEEVDFSIINSQTTVVSLTELDKPVFQNITEERFSALKQMFGYGKKLVWITSDRLDHQPYSNLTLGFGRTAVVETPDLSLQQLDVADPLAVSAQNIVRIVLRFVSTVPDTILWSKEPEIIVDSLGRERIPRLKPILSFNNRHNSSVRVIKQLVSTEDSAVALKTTEKGWISRDLTPRFSESLEEIDLRTTHSISTAIKTAVGHQYLILCVDKASEKMYAALVPSLASAYRLPITSIVPYMGDASTLSLLAAQVISASLLDIVSAGSTVLVHNATAEMAIALKAQSSLLDINLAFTSDFMDDPPERCKLTPYMTQYQLNKLVPTGIALFVGLSNSESQMEINEVEMMSCLPQHCRRETSRTLFCREGLSSAAPTANILQDAVNKVATYDPTDVHRARSLTKSIDVRSILEGASTDDPLAVIDWTTSRMLPITVEKADIRQKFRSDRTYWILGLSASLGASLCDWMIRQGAKNLVYTSRRPQLDESWIDSHRQDGVRIKVVACDLTDKAALQCAHMEICAELPPIAGVLNGAAVFRDNSILNMSFAELNDSLRPKVLGSLYLDRIFHDQDLEFFILTSSITGLLGSEGQANYAAANTFMCGLAAQRRRRGLAATAINLGAIVGIGMLERGDRKVSESIMQRLSLMPVSEGDFHQIIAEAIEAGRPDSAICGPELTTALRAVPFDQADSPGFFSNPMFSHFRLVGLDPQKTKGSKSNSVKELIAACKTKAELQSIIRGAFSNELRKVLDTTMSDDKLLEMRSIELGIDSLVSIDLRTWFANNLKVNIPVLKIMDNNPTGDLVLFAVDHVPAELVPMVTDRERLHHLRF